jgi:hypothetical protein
VLYESVQIDGSSSIVVFAYLNEKGVLSRAASVDRCPELVIQTPSVAKASFNT